jgi:hypothetical protein
MGPRTARVFPNLGVAGTGLVATVITPAFASDEPMTSMLATSLLFRARALVLPYLEKWKGTVMVAPFPPGASNLAP